MQLILCATDLSPRADLAVDRAAALARQFGARLRLLHVVDEDQPPAIVDAELAGAREALDARLEDLDGTGTAGIESEVRAGSAFRAIVTSAQAAGADVVVMGAHRRRILKDVVIGTTIERVLRTGTHPVLMVNTAPKGPYASVLLALDASAASAVAVNAARAVRLLDKARLSVVRGFEPVYKGMLKPAGVHEQDITAYSDEWASEARVEIRALLRQAGLDDASMQILTEEGPPFTVVRRAVERLKPQLLVIGTHGRTGLRRALLGSVAERVISEVECDVLVVPVPSS